MPAPASRARGDEARSGRPQTAAAPTARPPLTLEQTHRILFDAACDCIGQAEQDLAAALGRGDQAAVLRLHDELALYDVLVTRLGEELQDTASQSRYNTASQYNAASQCNTAPQCNVA